MREPVEICRSAQVENWEDTGNRYSKQSHRPGKAVDGPAPFLSCQYKDGGDERAAAADRDPPDITCNGVAPDDGRIYAPGADSINEQPGNCRRGYQQKEKAEAKSDPP